jgi:hypothetical protein
VREKAAIKQDLELARLGPERDLGRVDARLRAEIKRREVHLARDIVGLGVALAAAMIGTDLLT